MYAKSMPKYSYLTFLFMSNEFVVSLGILAVNSILMQMTKPLNIHDSETNMTKKILYVDVNIAHYNVLLKLRVQLQRNVQLGGFNFII